MAQLDLDHFFDPSSRKKWRFTLEYGRGETYRNSDVTLYAHSTYERSSVLAGRPQRVFVHAWSSLEEAQAALADAKKTWKRFKWEDCLGSSTHIPVSQIVAHLPDDSDY